MRIGLPLLALLLMAQAPAPPPPPTERPLTLPTRDVDVTYRLGQIAPATAPRVIEQRLRYDAGTGMLRVDPPTPGLYVIFNTRTRRMLAVRMRDHTVLVLNGAGPAGTMPGQAAGGRFIREGQSRVASLACTEWQTTDIAGNPALICVTADGVMLRAVTAGRTVLEATRVVYGPIEASVFRAPAGYVRVSPPRAAPAH